MHLATLVELLEDEIGSSSSARASLDELLAERAPADATTRPSSTVRPVARRAKRASVKPPR